MDYCVERAGTSRSGYLQFVRQWRLVPTAHARRYALLDVLGSPSNSQWLAMKTGLRVSALVVGVCCMLAFSDRLEAATQVEGTATYEVFSNGTRRLLVEEQFSALVEGDRWAINTRLVSTQPPLARPELFCPLRQSAGSDGTDVYYLKEMAPGTGQALVGWIEPGPVPNIAQSPTVCLLWMAYCSGYYLAKAERQELRPVWGTDVDRSRRGECLVNVSSHRSLDSPGYLDELNFLSDGRINPCNPSRGSTNVWSGPWAGGFTQAIFRVERTTALPAGGRVPRAFRFELLKPVLRVSPPKLNALSAMHGTVATVTGGVEVVSWLPPLPKDRQVMVDDYRFTGEVTNWESVAYAITNQWSARNGAVANAAANIHARTPVLVLTTDTSIACWQGFPMPSMLRIENRNHFHLIDHTVGASENAEEEAIRKVVDFSTGPQGVRP